MVLQKEGISTKRTILRDQKGKIMVPLIMYRRTCGKDTSVNFSKIDANNPKLFTHLKRNIPQNRYDNFQHYKGSFQREKDTQ